MSLLNNPIPNTAITYNLLNELDGATKVYVDYWIQYMSNTTM